jgi:hypothetical protein
LPRSHSFLVYNRATRVHYWRTQVHSASPYWSERSEAGVLWPNCPRSIFTSSLDKENRNIQNRVYVWVRYDNRNHHHNFNILHQHELRLHKP